MVDREEIVTQPIGDPDAAVVTYAPAERYTQRATLAVGGMGEVRLCLDRAIGREVAMKVVSASHAKNGELEARFVREARVQGQLEHPAIVPVYDFGVDAQGNAYFTMKRVRGVTLASILDGLRLRDGAVMREYGRHKLLAAFVQVCRAIDYAHGRGVLHRDLKPSNVMLGPYGEVYVLDWGLAKVRGAEVDLDPLTGEGDVDAPANMTSVGTVFGTPGYMAPEQVAGGAVDERTDVYLLGAILFELLTGEALHGKGSAKERMERAAKGADARPSVVAPKAEAPPELEDVCVRACARAPSERFASVRELAEAVEAYLSGDRDLELRRELSAVHLARAREAASRAEVPGAEVEERRAALAEAGRAVALSPDDREARQVLLEVLTKPPREPPQEVLQTMEHEANASHQRLLPRVALLFLAPWLFVLPATFAIGARDWRMVAFSVVPWLLCSAQMLVAHRLRRSTDGSQRWFSLMSATAVAVQSVYYGPAIVVPTLAVVIAFGIGLQQRPQNVRFAAMLHTLAIFVPTLLTLRGMLPVRYEMLGDALLMRPGAVLLTPTTLLVITACVNALVLFAGVRYGSKYREATRDLALANHLSAWQLKHLVPEEAALALSTPPPPP